MSLKWDRVIVMVAGAVASVFGLILNLIDLAAGDISWLGVLVLIGGLALLWIALFGFSRREATVHDLKANPFAGPVRGFWHSPRVAKTRRALAIGFWVIAAFVFTLALVAYLPARFTTGDAALAAMSEEEREFLNSKVRKITPAMGQEQVAELLGPPSGSKGSSRVHWRGPNRDAQSRITVEFRAGKAVKVSWLKLFRFFYEFEPK